MQHFLLKTEPSEYSFADLQHDKRTVWDGVANASALKNIRSMNKGDEVFIYHTGDEKAVVGIAKVSSAPYADPNGDSEKQVVVDLKPVRALAKPLTLADIKADKIFAGWDLIRIGRLSVVPTSAKQWAAVLERTE